MEKITVPNEILLGEAVRVLNQGKMAVIPTKGYSMLPFIHGCRDSVRLQKREELRDYDIVLAHFENGQYILHRIIKIDEENVTLMGDGNSQGRECCLRKDIVGTAVAIIHPDGTETPCYTPWQLMKAKCWRGLLPVRKYILGIYRRILKYTEHEN